MFFMSARKARKESEREIIKNVECDIRIAIQSGDNYVAIFGGIPKFVEKILKLKGYEITETNHGVKIEW